MLTRAQREALARIYRRLLSADPAACPTYRAFRRSVQPYIGGDCVLVPFCGMWLGIERDGYTHS
jgi:hypothetical protein